MLKSKLLQTMYFVVSAEGQRVSAALRLGLKGVGFSLLGQLKQL